MLDKQINIYAVDTGNFYSNSESYLHRLNHRVRVERNKLKKEISFYDECFSEIGFTHKDIQAIRKGDFDNVNYINGSTQEFQDVINYYHLYQLYLYKGKKAKETKKRILSLLQNKVNANIESKGKHHIRELRFLDMNNRPLESLNKNIISVFDSSFTRMIGAKSDTLSEDFMVVQIYYFDVAKDLIYYGFAYKGEKYIYFTSSAGQIRTKKCVFIKESVYKKYEKTMMCGLTLNSINDKGGCNPNKYLAYMALNNSATDVWKEFDIDKTIVVDDFETNVYGTFDFVDDKDFIVKRMSDYVPITHTDGAGMILPNAFGKQQKNMMVRLPWIKGLLGVFDYVRFINEHECSAIIKDIYGKEHDVIAEDIQVIFTKSQFKMYKYYDSWEQYKTFYKEYRCAAGFTNPEEDRIPDATINYQMLQSLTDITDEEINELAHESIDRLNNICSNIETIRKAFGATPYNQYKTPFQEAIIIYPELLNDAYVRNMLREIKNSWVNNYKAGRLRIKGKYTFLLPDFYAACEYWFCHNDNPDGLLADGETFCSLFPKHNELDCLRSPHLYKEHAIRKNIACNCKDYEERKTQIEKWFTTSAVYTSCHDLISKILMFDVDGDKSLVVADETLVSVAKRNMIGIVPLYYDMKKALPSILSNETIYNGLSTAFTGSNIGQYSNSISKIWNSKEMVSGSEEEKEGALTIIKLLCMLNNCRIDFAKTLYMPEEPKDIKDKMRNFTKRNVPHFFIYAKGKEVQQVENVTDSIVDKLSDLIPCPNISIKEIKNNKSQKLEKPDYRLLMHNPDLDIATEKHPVILKYCELVKEYSWQLSLASEQCDGYPAETLMKTKIKYYLLYNEIIKNIIAAFSQFNLSDIEIVDILVKYLYCDKSKSDRKSILWMCYGDIILENLRVNKNKCDYSKEAQCIDCGEWFYIDKKDTHTCRCNKCLKEHKKEMKRLENQRYNERKKLMQNN